MITRLTLPPLGDSPLAATSLWMFILVTVSLSAAAANTGGILACLIYLHGASECSEGHPLLESVRCGLNAFDAHPQIIFSRALDLLLRPDWCVPTLVAFEI